MAKKALLVGINRYRIPGVDLRGCVNDVQQMRQLLIELYDFPEPSISVLTDYEATKDAMQHQLDDLVSNARAGDVVYVHFSGHGSNVPDSNGDEADSRDEILCPTDLDWRDPLLDDWLRDCFDAVATDVNLTVVMDCCHSGTISRGVRPPDTQESIERFLPCPLDIFAAESGRTLQGTLRGVRRERPVEEIADGLKNVSIPEILITACRDDQSAADAYIEGDFHGALTHSLARTITDASGHLSLRELHAGAKRVMAGTYGQEPQLEGRATSFGRRFLSPLA